MEAQVELCTRAAVTSPASAPSPVARFDEDVASEGPAHSISGQDPSSFAALLAVTLVRQPLQHRFARSCADHPSKKQLKAAMGRSETKRHKHHFRGLKSLQPRRRLLRLKIGALYGDYLSV